MVDNIAYPHSTYVNQSVAANGDPRRFEDTELYLRDIVILVSVKAQLFGDSGGQTYPVGIGESIGLTEIDISTLYFKNAVADEDGTVDILAVRR
ncbi:hypothetical protein ES708_13703 [subsurface metagenome]